MNRSKATLTILVVMAMALALSSGGKGCTPIVEPPSPISELGFKTLIVEESANRDKLTKGQRAAMDSTAKGSLREYVESKGGELRVLDNDDSGEYLTPAWKTLLERAPKDDAKLPWIEIANPPKFFEGPLPDDAVTLAQKYGG